MNECNCDERIAKVKKLNESDLKKYSNKMTFTSDELTLSQLIPFFLKMFYIRVLSFCLLFIQLITACAYANGVEIKQSAA
jgi:hypothetical protein